MPSKARKTAAQASYQQGERKNFIINGDMAICQRATSSSSLGAASGYFVQDRWRIGTSTTGEGRFTMSQDAEAPDGFANSMKIDCTTAEDGPAADEYLLIQQRFEGLNLQSLNQGDAQAKAVTVSFWVRSPKTGVHTVTLYKKDDADGNNRLISSTYTIASADTWEYHTCTFAGDTTGAIPDDNSEGFSLWFWLLAGSDRTSGTLATSWESYTAANTCSSSQVNVLDNTSNNFYLTGVQMELGNTATDFQYESFKENLSRCQRYFMAYGPSGTDATDDYVVIGTGLAAGTTISWIEINPPTPMRTRPSATFNTVYVFDANNRTLGSITYFSGEDGAVYRPFSTVWIRAVNTGSTTNNTTGRGAQLYLDAATDSYFWLSAEL